MAVDFKPNQNNYKNLTPFKSWLMLQINTWGQNNFPFVESDFDELTNYGMMQKLMKAVNDVIDNENLVEEDMSNLFDAFTELQNYVNNYFDNLDVQDEINNKLDSMAEDGSLTTLISAYIDPIYQAYETRIDDEVDSMNNQLQLFDTRLTAVASGSPLVASSTSDMTNTSRIYVNTSDGKWYYYNGSAWTIGGTYQSTEVGDKTITYNKTKFLRLGNQLFNKDTITQGKYVNYQNGQLFNANDSCVSDYIIVSGLTHIISNYSNQVAFYDANKTFISGYNATDGDVPSNAYYVRVTIPNSTNAINKYMLNSGTSVLPYENYSYINDYLVLYTSKLLFDKLINKDNTDFVISGKNLIDYNKIIKGKFIVYTTGYENTNANFVATDYIELDETQTQITSYPYSGVNAQTAFYNKNKQYISGDYASQIINIPANAKYMRTSFPITLIDREMFYYGSTASIKYEPYQQYLYKTSGKNIYVGANRDIKTLKEGIEEASKYWEANLYVDEGVYDLVNEFGSDYLENNNSDKGLILKNRMHLIFDSNAFVTFNYTGDNSYIHTQFSPFNSGLYGFTIENLNLTASNCRYCVHDERGGSTDAYINKYINCKMSLDNSQNPDWTNPQNIGAGLGEKGYIIVDGCHFNHYCTWHNNNNTGYLNSTSKVIIKNNYFDYGFIYATDDYKTNFNNPSLFYVYNNCVKGNIITTQGNNNIIVKEWNNVQHD